MSWKSTALRAGRIAAARHPMLVRRALYTGASAAWHVLPAVRSRVIANLLPVVAGDERLARRASRHAFRAVAGYYADLLSLPVIDLDEYNREKITVENPGYLDVILSPGPAIIVSAHMGNPELAIQALIPRGRAFAALVEELQPRDFAHEMLELRRAGGGVFLESNRSGVKGLLRHVEGGGLVALVGDRDIAGNGIPVALFGRQVRISALPWEVARRTGAPVVPAFSLRRRNGKMLVTLGEPFRVEQAGDAAANMARAAQRWAGDFERQLRRAPGQWYVMEDFWRVHGVGNEQVATRGGEGVQ